MRNHNLVKCFYCHGLIDKSKATTEKEHEFVRFVVGEVYFHKNKCFDEYEYQLRLEKEKDAKKM